MLSIMRSEKVDASQFLNDSASFELRPSNILKRILKTLKSFTRDLSHVLTPAVSPCRGIF